jgi:iron uptake system component EfeO
MKNATFRNLVAGIAKRRRLFAAVPALVLIAIVAGACGTSSTSSSASAGGSASTTVNIALTPAGCAPKPAKIPAGSVTVNVSNKDADAVSEAELRTGNLSNILGEQENLTPGLSGGFSLNIAAGHYIINCPGASKMHWAFTVTGKNSGNAWKQNPVLVGAVKKYGQYVDKNVGALVTSSEKLCKAISTGDLTTAQLAYPKSRVFYERIEPVAEIWGALDTNIDGRWDNPVTVPSQFIGFHKIEQMMWEYHTLKRTPQLCAGLIHHERQLHALVKAAAYNPLEMASGAADLISEAGTAKVTGEEERYSNTDLVVLQANVDGSQEVVNLLRPYLQKKDPKLLAQIDQREQAATAEVAKFKASPGYDGTGYVEYSTVLNGSRKQLSKVLGAYEKSLSQLSLSVTS